MRRLLTSWLLFFILLSGIKAQPSATINIWQGVAHHHKVELTPYLASGQGNVAVVVCPGGSYFWHDMEHEGKEVGEWLQKNGISAFVLRYRTAYVPAFITGFRWVVRGNRYPDAQDDLLQSLRLLRQNAAQWGIDTTRIGAMGFSAGGHLVMSSAELFAPAERPSFIVPIYPVVTMQPPYVHRRSRRALLGDNRKHDRHLRDSLSLELHVPADCPPVFLVNCQDDPIVQYQNSVLLDSALTAKGIPHRYIQYRTGGHGFGASDTKGTPECRAWKGEFLRWLAGLWTDTSHSFLTIKNSVTYEYEANTSWGSRLAWRFPL